MGGVSLPSPSSPAGRGRVHRINTTTATATVSEATAIQKTGSLVHGGSWPNGYPNTTI